MATVGQTLATPETGWRRYDDTDSRIKYDGIGVRKTGTGYYNSTMSYIQVDTIGKIIFKFYGTKFRILSDRYTEDRSSTILLSVYVDGVLSGTYTTYGAQNKIILHHEISNLSLGFHKVEIVCNELNSGALLTLDAIDIDSNGYLLHPILNQKTNIEDMEIGDCIPCKYFTGASGSPGYFSELGTCIANEIPISSTATPNGLFYFIKADKGLLIADRVVQHSIAWDKLNAVKYIEGLYKKTNISESPLFQALLNIPISLSSTEYVSSVTGTLSTETSPYGQATYFNGSNRINLNAKIIPIGAKSIRFKIKCPPNDITSKYILSNINASGNQYGIIIYINNVNGIIVTITNNSNNTSYILSIGSSKIIADNQWHDVLFTWDGTTNTNAVKLYIDNELNNQRTANSIEATQPTYNLTIGSIYNSQGSGQYAAFKGYLYGLEVYNYPINVKEVDYIARSLTGGNSYLDSNGVGKITNSGLGAWPPNNEWDKYIVHSDLEGKITPGDNNIWHWKDYLGITLCGDTPILNLNRYNNAFGAATDRINRSWYQVSSTDYHPDLIQPWFNNYSTFNSTFSGFRPVLEYKDNDKQSNLWY